MTAQHAITAPQRAKLTARDFWLLADAGAFEGFARTELIEGEIWVVNSVWVWHARTVAYFTIELGIALRDLGSDLLVYGAGSVDLTDDSVPQPDVAIGEAHEGKGLPGAKLRLAVEVSDSTLDADLGRKAPLYARGGVPEYWIVDREHRRVIQFSAPNDGSYARRRDIPLGERIEAATIAGLAIPSPAA